MASFAKKIIDGFNVALSFIGSLFSSLFDLISGSFQSLFEFLAVPLGWLVSFFEGVFYFFEKLFTVLVVIVKIFVALFQYLGSLIAGVFRMIKGFLTVDVNASTKFVSTTEQGFSVVVDLLHGTGLLTVVPLVATAFVWFFFCLKVFQAFGGTISVSSPFSNSQGDKL